MKTFVTIVSILLIFIILFCTLLFGIKYTNESPLISALIALAGSTLIVGIVFVLSIIHPKIENKNKRKDRVNLKIK